MADDITDAALADLFVEAGHRHHSAYAASDGVDPEWPIFYAAYVQTRLWDRLGVLLTRSELIHIAVSTDLAILNGEVDGAWSSICAQRTRSFALAKAAR